MIKRIVAFTGYAQSGKDTAAAMLWDKGYEQYRFALKIYEMLAVMMDVTVEKVNEMKVNNECIPGTLCTVRSALQTLGSEWGRDLVDENVWVILLNNRIVNKMDTLVVIPDLRFINEVQELTRFALLNGFDLDIVGIERDSSQPQTHHQSEMGIVEILEEHATHIIDNNGTLDDLEEEVLEIITKG
jgi:hypothetical protein